MQRPLRIEAEHDRGVPELQVEIDQKDALARLLGEVRREVGGEHGLAGASLGREDRHHTPARCVGLVTTVGAGPAACLVGLADCERDRLRQLRQHEHVVDTRREGGLDEVGTRSRHEQNDRRLRVQADARRPPSRTWSRRDHRRGLPRAAPHGRRTEPRYGTASRTSAVQATTSSPLPEALERLVQLRLAVERARHDNAERLRAAARGERRHLLPPASTVVNVSTERLLSFGFLTGRSCSVQSPFFIT